MQNEHRKALAARLLVGTALAALAACASDSGPDAQPSSTSDPQEQAQPRASSPTAKAAPPAAATKQREPQPIAVLIETDPGLIVAGSDTPRVAVYSDGLVIGVRAEQGEPVYVSGQLSTEALAQLKRDLGALANPAAWEARYDLAPGVPDQPETRLYLRLGERAHATSIYGFPRRGAASAPAKRPTSPPAGLLGIHRYLCGLGLQDASPWIPKLLEVLVWSEPGADFAGAPAWPLGWAAFDSPRTIRRGEGSYSIFLAGSRLQDLRAFLAEGGGKARIDGRGWWVDFRFAFPSYRVYEEAFAR